MGIGSSLGDFGRGLMQGATGNCPDGQYFDQTKNMCVPVSGGGVTPPTGLSGGSTPPSGVSTGGVPSSTAPSGTVMQSPVNPASTTGSPSSTGMGSTAGGLAGGAIGGPPGAMLGSMAGGMLEDTVMSFSGDDETGADKLNEEKAKTENWSRKMRQKYTGPQKALASNLTTSAMLAGGGAAMGAPMIGAGLAGANATQFLLREILPYLRDPSRVTSA